MARLRSMLFAPGSDARKVDKAMAGNADAVILDLEDAVALDAKVRTRADVTQALARKGRAVAYVRINALDTPFALGDLEAIAGPNLDGIILPKVEAPWHMAAVDWVLGDLERRHGMAPNSIDLIPTVETALGLDLFAWLQQPIARIRRVAFGAGDYSKDVGIRWDAAEQELAFARHTVVVRSRAARLEAPLDTVYPWIRDADGLLASAECASRMGFQGKLCIHPAQVEPVNAAFSPSADDLARAERIVAAFDVAERDGVAAIQVDGALIDYPVAERARALLARAQARS